MRNVNSNIASIVQNTARGFILTMRNVNHKLAKITVRDIAVLS